MGNLHFLSKFTGPLVRNGDLNYIRRCKHDDPDPNVEVHQSTASTDITQISIPNVVNFHFTQTVL